MKNYSIRATDENLFELLRDDRIERRNSVFRFIDLLNSIDDCCTIAINGEWGSGKTFFVRQVKLILDAMNDHSKMENEEMRGRLRSLYQKISRFEECECYSTVYYDAWMYDNHDDPILSLIHATIASNQTDFSEKSKRSILNEAAAVAGAVTGRDISKVIEEARGKDTFESFKEADEIHKMVHRFIDALVKEHGNRLVFFIDELDRCKPDYAIQFMERIKHYFDDERVTFVFSVSLSQLQATVKHFYGVDFDSTRYLDKFFDLRVPLPKPNIEKYMQVRMGFYSNSIVNDVCIEVVKYHQLTLRETERFIRLAKIAACPAANQPVHFLREGDAHQFCSTYVIPVMLGLQMTDIKKYNAFISGDDFESLLKIMELPNIQIDYNQFLGFGERYDRNSNTIIVKEGDKAIPFNERLEAVYKAIFTKTSDHQHLRKDVGQMCISSETRKFVDETIALLSPISMYDYE